MESCKDDDFYVIVPSSDDENFYPHNEPDRFSINWKNGLELHPEDRWKVAVTNFSYMYKPNTITTNYGIYYKYGIVHTNTYNVTLTIKTDKTYQVNSSQDFKAKYNVEVDFDNSFLYVGSNNSFTIEPSNDFTRNKVSSGSTLSKKSTSYKLSNNTERTKTQFEANALITEDNDIEYLSLIHI